MKFYTQIFLFLALFNICQIQTSQLAPEKTKPTKSLDRIIAKSRTILTDYYRHPQTKCCPPIAQQRAASMRNAFPDLYILIKNMAKLENQLIKNDLKKSMPNTSREQLDKLKAKHDLFIERRTNMQKQMEQYFTNINRYSW